jgi:hypothetical protein
MHYGKLEQIEHLNHQLLISKVMENKNESYSDVKFSFNAPVISQAKSHFSVAIFGDVFHC